MAEDDVRLRRDASEAPTRRRLVIGEDDLDPERADPVTRVPPDAGDHDLPPLRPRSSGRETALGAAAIAVKLVSAVVIALAVAGYVYGGTDAAHGRCLEHRLAGGSGLGGDLVCAVEH